MEEILRKITEQTKLIIEQKQAVVSISEMKAVAEAIPKGWFPFISALKKPSLSFICEEKKASPEEGTVLESINYLDLAKEYEAAGADAICVATEPDWYKGSEDELAEISENVRIPLLRKDFIIDPYMIYESKVKGADAINLICKLLEESVLREFINIGKSVGLCSMVVANSPEDVEKATNAGAEIISVNKENAISLRPLIPSGVKFVIQHGIKEDQDIFTAKKLGADGVILGSALIQTHDRALYLDNFRKLL